MVKLYSSALTKRILISTIRIYDIMAFYVNREYKQVEIRSKDSGG